MLVSDLHGPWSAIRRAPMVRLAGPLVLGVMVAAGTDPLAKPMLLALLCATVALVTLLLLPTPTDDRWRRGVALAAWLFAFGAAWQAVRAPRNDALHLRHSSLGEGHWLLKVEAVNRSGGRSVNADGIVLAALQGDSARVVHGRVLLSLGADSTRPMIRPGDRVLATGRMAVIDRIPDPGGFDRRGWARSRGIAHELYSPSASWSLVGHDAHWTELFNRVRALVGEWLSRTALNARETALVKALVLGERDEVDGERRDAFVRSGTIHVLAVSGMHVGLIYLVLTLLLGALGKSGWARIVRGLLVLACLWLYAGLTGASPSVMRASVMFSLFTIAGMGRQRTDHLNSLFAAAGVLLIWDPGMLTQASFQLSFLAVLGIILFQRPLEALWTPRSSLVRKAWALAAMSIAAQTLTTPVSLLLFQGFPAWFLPANLVVVTAVGFAVYAGVALIAFHAVPYLGDAIAFVLRALIAVIDSSTTFFAALPGAYPSIRIGGAEAGLLAALILAGGAWWRWRWGMGRVLTWACCAALLGSWAWRASASHERETFVVYDQHRGLLAGMVVGRELVVAASADSLLADSRVVAKLERHQRHDGIVAIRPAGTDHMGPTLRLLGHVLMGGGRIRAPGIDVLFHDGSHPPPASGRFDAVVLCGRQWPQDVDLDRLAERSARLVLAADLPSSVRRRVREWAEQRGVPVHDVRERGAFVLQARS